MQQQGNYGMIKNAITVGLGTVLLLLFFQRKELNKYGHELYGREINIDEDVGVLKKNPKFKKMISAWENKGKVSQVYLFTGKKTSIDKIDDKDVVHKYIPMIVKNEREEYWAYTHAKKGKIKGVQLDFNNKDKTIEEQVKSLKFRYPYQGQESKFEQINNESIVNHLVKNHNHLHVSANIANKDTGMDNRVLILKNSRKDRNDFYAYAQNVKGKYCLQKVALKTLKKFNLRDETFFTKEIKKINKDYSLIDTFLTKFEIKSKMQIKANTSTFNAKQLTQATEQTTTALKVFGGVLGATKAPMLFSTAASNATYTILNKITHALENKKTIPEMLKDTKDVLRNAF